MRTVRTIGLGGAAAAVGLAAAAVLAERRSAARPEERRSPLPGDELVPGARVVIDRATTLPAPPQRVWPWLVQLGKGRAGWYLPAAMETLIPADGRGSRSLVAEFQDLAVGDEVPDWGPGEPVFRVVTVNPPRALVYLSVRDRDNDHRWPESGPPYPASALVFSWALVLSAATGPGGSAASRLQLRLRVNRVGRRAPALVAFAAGLVDAMTVAPLFAGLAERVR